MATVPSIGRAGVDAPFEPEAEATRALYERYANQIYGYCFHQLGSREEAEDAVQSTFLNAFRGLRRGVEPELEQAWLFKIAQNVCLSRRRSTWRRGRIESPAAFEFAEETAPAPHRRADELIGLQDVLEHMPENQRRAILLREWQGLSYREIAEELELSQAAVETLIFRARRALAQGLEASPAEQRSWRQKVRSSFDLGNLLGGLKSLLASGLAAKAAGTAAVVAVTTVTVAPPVVHQLTAPHRSHVRPAAHAVASSAAAVRSSATPAAGAQHATPKVAAKHKRRPLRSQDHAPSFAETHATDAAAGASAAAAVDATTAPAPAPAQAPAPAPAPPVSAPADAGTASAPAPAPQPAPQPQPTSSGHGGGQTSSKPATTSSTATSGRSGSSTGSSSTGSNASSTGSNGTGSSGQSGHSGDTKSAPVSQVVAKLQSSGQFVPPQVPPFTGRDGNRGPGWYGSHGGGHDGAATANNTVPTPLAQPQQPAPGTNGNGSWGQPSPVPVQAPKIVVPTPSPQQPPTPTTSVSTPTPAPTPPPAPQPQSQPAPPPAPPVHNDGGGNGWGWGHRH